MFKNLKRWKTIIQFIITVLTAIISSFFVQSCMKSRSAPADSMTPPGYVTQIPQITLSEVYVTQKSQISQKSILLDDSHEMTALFLMPGIKVCFCWKCIENSFS